MDPAGQIAELKAELAARDARIAEQDAQLAAKDARIEEHEQLVVKLTKQVVVLTKQVEVLTEKLGRNSRNSHRPPSSDPPGRAGSKTKSKKSKKNRKSKRKRGGQPGHRGSHRELLPSDQVNEFCDLFPRQCENCWRSLAKVPDGKAKRYQVTEVPPMRPHTVEFRRHAVVCASCGHKTRAPYDTGVIPALPFGPRLMSLVALLVGVYHSVQRLERPNRLVAERR